VTLDLRALLTDHLRGGTARFSKLNEYLNSNSSCVNPIAGVDKVEECHQATSLAAFLQEQDGVLHERSKREGFSLPFSAPMGSALLEVPFCTVRSCFLCYLC
jgi:hypothetical protein